MVYVIRVLDLCFWNMVAYLNVITIYATTWLYVRCVIVVP